MISNSMQSPLLDDNHRVFYDSRLDLLKRRGLFSVPLRSALGYARYSRTGESVWFCECRFWTRLPTESHSRYLSHRFPKIAAGSALSVVGKSNLPAFWGEK